MSDNDKKDNDLTRIEDLSDFIHDENEDTSGLNSYDDDDEDLMDQATDPDIEFPAEFNPSADAQADEADDDGAFNTEFEAGEEASVDFGASDDSNDDEDSFGSDDEDSFGSDDGDSFGSDDGDSFGSDDDGDSFASDDDGDSFGSDDDGDSFGSDDDGDSFGSDDDGDSFGSDDDGDSFGSDDDNFQSEELSAMGEDESEEDFNEQTFDEPADDISDEPNIDEPSINEPSISQSDSIEAIKQDSPQSQQYSSENNDNHTEIKKEKTPIAQYADKEEYKSPENFNELQKFAKNISYGNMGHEGNPPFSIILKDIKFKEDIEEIVEILKEFNILDDESAKTASDSLHRGNMLIPRLGEYSAIHICHKLRKFDVTILMGLTEEVHPPKSYESDDSGIVSKYTVYNTRSHHFVYNKDDIQLSDIMTSTTPSLEGYHIREYITVGSEYIILDSKTISDANNLEGELKQAIPDYQREKLDKTEVRSANLQAANSGLIKDFFPSNEEVSQDKSNSANLNDVYQSLLEKLKLKALKNKGNAIIGVHYNVTPILKDQVYYTETQYQITCSGSIVWANRV